MAPAQRPIEPPRLARSLLLQLLVIAAGAMATELPWHGASRSPVPPPHPPHKEERRIRVVRIEKPPAPKPPAVAQQQPRAQPPPKAQPEPPKPSPAKLLAHAQPSPKPLPAHRIAADSTSVHGVRMRVLVPRSASDLAAHLRNSGGCLVVSRLVGGEAEVVSMLGADGRPRDSAPCDGVPRLLSDRSLNDVLGDPLGKVRSTHPEGELVLQVLLTSDLHASARSALRARFGAVSDEEMGRRAAESGYELTCFAEPSGNVRCQ